MDHETDEPKAWRREMTSRWNDVRVWMAFAICAAGCFLVVSIKFGFAGAPDSVIFLVARISLMLGCRTVLFGPSGGKLEQLQK
jgi:hypothetical protein